MKLNIIRLDGADSPDQSSSPGAPGESEWIFAEVENLQTLHLAAQRGRDEAVKQLLRIAEELCPEVWDRVQRSRGQSTPSPAEIADLVIRSTRPMLMLARLAQQTDAGQVQALAQEVAALHAENISLRQRATAAEEAIRAWQEEKLKAEQRRQAEAEKKANVLLEKGRIRDRQEQQREMREVPETRDKEKEAEVQTAHSKPGTAIIAAAGVADTSANELRVEVLIRLIASTGIARSKEIRERLAAELNINTEKSTQTIIASAAMQGLIEIVFVSNEYRGAGKVSMVTLTEAGENKAAALGVKPVVSQYALGLAIHKSAEQTYAVLDVADILCECGYQNVDPFPKPLRFGGLEYRPDMTALDPASDEMLLIEYERPTFKNNDGSRPDKWLRALQFGNGLIYLVTPNRDTLASLQPEIVAQIKQSPLEVKGVRAFNISDYRADKEGKGIRGGLWQDAWQVGAG